MKIELGSEVIDRITKFRGIAIARTEYLNGCVRYGVQGPYDPDKKRIPSAEWIDEEQLELIEKTMIESGKPSGGPHAAPRGRPNPSDR